MKNTYKKVQDLEKELDDLYWRKTMKHFESDKSLYELLTGQMSDEKKEALREKLIEIYEV